MTRRNKRRHDRLKSFWRSAKGNAAVEFALVAPFLIGLTVGAFDFGHGFYEQKRLTSAAYAGALHAFQQYRADGTEAAATDVIQSARNDAGDTANELDLTANYTCQCPNGATIACTALCTAGETPMLYITVSAQGDIDMLYDYPGISDPLTVNQSITMRIR